MSEPVYRNGALVSLRRIADVLRSIEGVESAETQVSLTTDGRQEIVALVSVSETSDLTPDDVSRILGERFPEECRPDRVLVATSGTRSRTRAARRRRAA